MASRRDSPAEQLEALVNEVRRTISGTPIEMDFVNRWIEVHHPEVSVRLRVQSNFSSGAGVPSSSLDLKLMTERDVVLASLLCVDVVEAGALFFWTNRMLRTRFA